jgi:hypothetical protein
VTRPLITAFTEEGLLYHFIVASNNFLDIFGSDEEAPEIEAGYEQLARVFKGA